MPFTLVKLLVCWLATVGLSSYAYNYMNKVERCELEAFSLGARIADALNAPLGKVSLYGRICQEVVMTELGFYPHILYCERKGETEESRNVRSIQTKGGWLGNPIENSSFAVLNHKWIYMIGDSTSRQIFSTFAEHFAEHQDLARNPKEYTRQYCAGHFHREDDAGGWAGPCMKNAVTCHISGFGADGVISWDWKHFPWEHYDEHLWGSEGHFAKGFPGEGDRRPEILVVQTGLHSCYHNYPENIYDVERLHEPNLTAIEQHKQDVRKLMQTMRSVIESYRSVRNHTHTVVFMTSGASFQSRNIDDCIVRFNRVVEETAHEFGFAVLERGALEARALYKSVGARDAVFPTDMHLLAPLPHVVTTVLVRLLTCLESIDMTANVDERVHI